MSNSSLNGAAIGIKSVNEGWKIVYGSKSTVESWIIRSVKEPGFTYGEGYKSLELVLDRIEYLKGYLSGDITVTEIRDVSA